jgi:hypothetical protein
MNETTIIIPGEFLRQVHEHVRATGEPLLREERSADVHTIRACEDGSGAYDLGLAEDDDFLASIDTWEEMADYMGMDVPDLVAKLKARGYPYDLPEVDSGEDSDEEDEWQPYVEADTIRDLLIDLAPSPTLRSVTADLHGRFAWDPATVYPGLPYDVEQALEWLDGRGSFGGACETHEMRSGTSEPVTWVPTATSLSCLQYALDARGRKARIVIWG